ncbi:NAD(P)/FAD-dependent oxidoreductase [Amphibacillus sediminis]|uniref:NAD(P)/FAD-dependent oxidoreductase n=1 Tax=Amphibacillus sediminis TaxID=360185 RepID=UPI000832E252|nr:NAD(P)/FAD-dependent oxidoreductase [Amphibacillus sediminis]
MLDCIIIGGGPAGLNAALMLGRAKRKVMLFDDNQPRNQVTQQSHGFITQDGIKPQVFRDLAHKDIAQYPSVTLQNRLVQTVSTVDHTTYTIITDKGQAYNSKKIILATGLKESLPEIEGIDHFYGKSLFSCPYCDGWELRDQPLVLISEDKDAAHLAKIIFQWSQDLVVCTNGKSILTPTEEQSLRQNGIEINKKAITQLEGTNGKIMTLVFEDQSILTRVGGFVTTSHRQANTFASSLGCQFNQDGGIVVDNLGRTNVLGVYAAGDASTVNPAKLIIAAGNGVRAAMGVNSDLAVSLFN